MKIALATLPFAGSVERAEAEVGEALHGAAAHGAAILCTPECYLPGLRGVGFDVKPVDAADLRAAFRRIGEEVKASGVALVLGCEYPTTHGPLISTLVYGRDGALLGRQDKVQLDPSENSTYREGAGRSLFEIDGLRFGISICHEAWRYPETVRWAARRGAHLVFIPHLGLITAWGGPPASWADPRNSFHEKAALCRAAENSVYVALVNYAIANSQTTSAMIDPDGRLLAHQPYCEAGLLMVDIDAAQATGYLAQRYRPEAHDAAPPPVAPGPMPPR